MSAYTTTDCDAQCQRRIARPAGDDSRGDWIVLDWPYSLLPTHDDDKRMEVITSHFCSWECLVKWLKDKGHCSCSVQ